MEFEASDQDEYDLEAIDARIESTLRRLIRLRRQRNFLASPLLRLPTELVLKIFMHTIGSAGDHPPLLGDDNPSSSENDGPTLLVLTAICRQLREIGMASTQLWSTVDLTIPPIAELFLERCKYDPRTIVWSQSASERRSTQGSLENPGMGVVWKKLKDCTFNNLRSIVFEGLPHEFAYRLSGVLRAAPIISNLDLSNTVAGINAKLPSLDNPIPNLSTLRLYNFSISWTSPLLRNLSHLTLDFDPSGLPDERTSIQTFLTALASCPNLETLYLSHAGPDLLSGRQDNCDVVVQLPRLRELSLEFRDPSRVGYILSHIGHPEFTELAVYVPADANADLSETISQVLPRRTVETIQRSRRSTALTIHLDTESHFFTDTFFICFQNRGSLGSRGNRALNLQVLPQLASKIVEVVGRDTITSLDLETWYKDLPYEMWEAFLHGLPRLERIRYDLLKGKAGMGLPDSFIFAFSRPFEDGLICPQLQDLELPSVVLAQHHSAAYLKGALAEREAHGRRLKRIGLSGDTTKVDDRLVLEPFRDLVDEVC